MQRVHQPPCNLTADKHSVSAHSTADQTSRIENPLCDGKYWQLLADILSPHHNAKNDDHVRAYRAWLIPVLARIPVAPIFLAYFDLLSTSESLDVAQCALVFRCISTLWPLAVPKFNPETLLECFGAVIQLGVSPAASQASCGKLQVLHDFRALSLIVSSYRAALAHSAAKKKVRKQSSSSRQVEADAFGT